MNLMNIQSSDVYEGNDPYLFISYSHKDQQAMLAVKNILKEHKIRYWYDNGLHSGDDWNMVIAKHLKEAAACLLLLSPNSAASDYVKNELNFAMNHRVPIHSLQIRQFELPIDIEMMTGRIQMIEMSDSFQSKLIKDLPPEIFSDFQRPSQGTDDYEHCLFEISEKLDERQGTGIFSARHKKLNYPCTLLEERLQLDEIAEIESRMLLVGKLSHSLFPSIADYALKGQRLLVYYENIGARFLDDYLEETSLSEEDIISRIVTVTEGIYSMYRSGIAFRDFARGSMIVTDSHELKFIRAYHPYYGYVRFQEETKRYYFEKELQEIGILLAQLCLGKEPFLPVRIIEEKRFSKKFLLKVNVIIQKCMKENGSAFYHSFDELLKDLSSLSVSRQEKAFLKNRAKRLLEYDKVREQRNNNFVSSDRPKEQIVASQSLEEEFGFEGTVVLQEAPLESKPLIRVQMCSTGQVLSFDKKEITIGKDARCDMIWTQPYISRMHLKIICNADGTYSVVDLNSTNHTFIGGEMLQSNVEKVVQGGVRIQVGLSEIQIL